MGNKKRFQILSLDGGGIKGIFSSAILAHLEDDLKIKIIDHLTNCHLCAQEFQFIICVFRFERKLNEVLCRSLQSKKEKFPIKRNIKQSNMKSFIKQKNKRRKDRGNEIAEMGRNGRGNNRRRKRNTETEIFDRQRS